MTDSKLAELQAIDRELDEVLANEHEAEKKLVRQFAEDHGAIEILLKSIQEAELDGRWRDTRLSVFDVLGQAICLIINSLHERPQACAACPIQGHTSPKYSYRPQNKASSPALPSASRRFHTSPRYC